MPLTGKGHWPLHPGFLRRQVKIMKSSFTDDLIESLNQALDHAKSLKSPTPHTRHAGLDPASSEKSRVCGDMYLTHPA
jgi:hypothetical protein